MKVEPPADNDRPTCLTTPTKSALLLQWVRDSKLLEEELLGERMHQQLLVREIGICYTCWWYSLCTFQYRQHYENTGSYHFECWIYTSLYFYIFNLCLNTIASMIITNVFFDFTDFQARGTPLLTTMAKYVAAPF